MKARAGQAMLESVIAIVIITSVFVVLFELSCLLADKILVEHAAMRVARARAVGFNAFMCLKTARVAMIPSAGERLHPDKDDKRGEIDEVALARMYMRTPDAGYAAGLLRYEGWDRLTVEPRVGDVSTVRFTSDRLNLRESGIRLTGEAGVDGFPFYLDDGL